MSTSIITDIHAHILPGIDDGPGTMEDTADLLKAFQETGTHRAFCTSHFCSPHFDVSFSALADGFTAVSQEFRSGEVELAPGAEVRLSSHLLDPLRTNQIPTLGNTQYVLVEFRTAQISEAALDLVHELVVRNLQPIMAHPERNIDIQKNPKLMDELADRGLLFQATAQAFATPKKEAHESEKLAWRLLEQGYIAVIASDAHNTTTRPPGLLEAYDNIAAKFGQTVANQLIDNANAIWDNEPCQELVFEAQKRSFLKGLLKR